jgi:sucrose phosphorylase
MKPKMKAEEKSKYLLRKIYGDAKGSQAYKKIISMVQRYPGRGTKSKEFFSQDDVVLITYGDTLIKKGRRPLEVFREFASHHLKGIFSTIHFLPFFPFSSDDGFSVIDFFKVNPELGSWDDIDAIGHDFNLMFDLVLNHISAQSTWFRKFLDGEEGYRQLAIAVDPGIDLSTVTRPRALPLLTAFKKKTGEPVHVWTTFSADQVDLNYEDIDVLLKVVEVLFFYLEKGASIIRLDAIAYLWKEIGTTCIHLPQTHDMVKLFRSLLDLVAPDAMIITETNVPHDENISYYGNGRDEAQMVYNFTLPPLLFYTFVKQDATELSNWADGLKPISTNCTFFNFTASHDGIGVRPLEGILSAAEVDKLVQAVVKNGGRVSNKTNADGTESPYELNITYVDALSHNGSKDLYHSDRFLASQAIQFSLPGVPATYLHSLVGSRNWNEGVRMTGRARTINREKLDVDILLADLNAPGSFRASIMRRYLDMIKIRKQQRAFHPNAAMEILRLHPKIFAMARYGDNQKIYILVNVSEDHVDVSLTGHQLNPSLKDLISGIQMQTASISLAPYQYVWLM